MDLQEIMQQRCVEMKMPGIPLTGQETLFPQPLQRVAFTIVRRHHAQAGGAAVHLVVLGVERKRFHDSFNYVVHIKINFLSYPLKYGDSPKPTPKRHPVQLKHFAKSMESTHQATSYVHHISCHQLS